MNKTMAKTVKTALADDGWWWVLPRRRNDGGSWYVEGTDVATGGTVRINRPGDLVGRVRGAERLRWSLRQAESDGPRGSLHAADDARSDETVIAKCGREPLAYANAWTREVSPPCLSCLRAVRTT